MKSPFVVKIYRRKRSYLSLSSDRSPEQTFTFSEVFRGMLDGATEVASEVETKSNQPEPKGWKVRRVGSVTFAISKPKRKARKIRQSRLKNRRRAR
jgi:hypothetical protein